MKTTFNNPEIPLLWLNQTQDRGYGSNFYFVAATIYSYGGHFPIARLYKGYILFTTQGYSSTTSCHMNLTHGAIKDAGKLEQTFTVADVMSNPSKKDLSHYAERIKNLYAQAQRARQRKQDIIEELRALVDEANRFVRAFDFTATFVMPNIEKI